MTLYRFFVASDWISGWQVTMTGEVVHRIRHVLRLKAGDRVIVLDNSGLEREVELERVGRNVIVGQIVDERPSLAEPGTRICLYQALLKGRKFEWVLQKGTELGIVEFIPIVCQRSVVGQVQDADGKQERWERIVREAAEQSRRGRLPSISPVTLFSRACQRAKEQGGLSLVPWEEETQISLKTALASGHKNAEFPDVVSVFVGPEGGLTEEEIQLATQYGIQPVSLGPRILRAETAGIVAASAILYEMEE